MVVKLYLKKKNDNPKKHYRKIFSEIATELGIEITRVQKIVSKYKFTIQNVNNYQKMNNELNEFTKITIRQTVHSFYINRNLPTVGKVYDTVKNMRNLPFSNKISFNKYLKSLHFKENKMKTNSLAVTERSKIILCRRNYLKSIMQYRQEKRTIYYLDETQIDLEEKKYIFSTSFKIPNKMLTLLHICSSSGFVSDGLLCIESTKDSPSISQDMFAKWFENILRSLDHNAVIVMDQNHCHSIKLEQIPDIHWNKPDIINWLEDKQLLNQRDNMVKAELLDIVKKHKEKYSKYLVDEMARRHSRRVLRLPLYHGEMNLMKFVWSLVENHIGNNTTSRDIYELVSEALNFMTDDKWKCCMDEVLQKENSFWELDNVMDEVLDNTGFLTDNCSDTSSDFEDL
ncbi:uncharacterized protein LOC126844665 isoform X2 [Adelges cooleyi]|nr:uncharacterized protein LOC126844665 isoform X2 [Adelges cooleyi]